MEDSERQEIDDLTEKIKQLVERENEHYTDMMLLLKQIEEKVDTLLQENNQELSEEDLYEEAKELVIEAGKASTSFLQRHLDIGYEKAARLIDELEENGVIGPADGSKHRKVLIEAED